MRKSYSIRAVFIGVSFFVLICCFVSYNHRKREFCKWYNGPKLVTAVFGKNFGSVNRRYLEDIVQEFQSGCEYYKNSHYRDFTYTDCKAELERLFQIDTRGHDLTENQIDGLTRKLIAMMRLNGERGHQLVYQFTIDSKALWLYQLWDTYEEFFGIDTVHSLLMSSKVHQIEVLDASSTGRIDPREYLTWRIGTYYAMHDREFAEKRAVLLIYAWSRDSSNEHLAHEKFQYGECILHYYRTQNSFVQEGPLSDD